MDTDYACLWERHESRKRNSPLLSLFFSILAERGMIQHESSLLSKSRHSGGIDLPLNAQRQVETPEMAVGTHDECPQRCTLEGKLKREENDRLEFSRKVALSVEEADDTNIALLSVESSAVATV